MLSAQILRFLIIAVCIVLIALTLIDKKTQKKYKILTISGLVLYLIFKEVMSPITINNTNNSVWILFTIVTILTIVINILSLILNIVKKSDKKTLIASIGGTAFALLYPITLAILFFKTM